MNLRPGDAVAVPAVVVKVYDDTGWVRIDVFGEPVWLPPAAAARLDGSRETVDALLAQLDYVKVENERLCQRLAVLDGGLSADHEPTTEVDDA